jgi:hypothetical protein
VVWLKTGYGLINGFIDHVYTPLGTTSNYSAIANLYTLQIITAPAKIFSSLLFFISRYLATDFNSGDSSASRAQVFLLEPHVQNSCQLSAELQRHSFSASLESSSDLVAPILFFITPRRRPHRKHSVTISKEWSSNSQLKCSCSVRVWAAVWRSSLSWRNTTLYVSIPLLSSEWPALRSSFSVSQYISDITVVQCCINSTISTARKQLSSALWQTTSV